MNILSPEEAEQYLAFLYTKKPKITDSHHLDWIIAVAKTRAVTTAGAALRTRAEKAKAQAPESRGLANFIGVMLGAQGYESKGEEQ